MGKKWSTDEHILATPDGKVVRARAIWPVPEETAWEAEKVRAIVGVPWAPSGTLKQKAEEAVVPELDRAAFEPERQPAQPSVPRGVGVTQIHLNKCGRTAGCATYAAVPR